jgi:hypothetical protein
MNPTRFLSSIGIATITLLAWSCSNSNSPTISEAGSIAGHLYVPDSMGLSSPMAGIEVSIPSLSRSTATDASGAWRFDNLPVGNYDLTATMQGYGTMKWFDEHVVGPGIFYLDPVTIPPLPRCQLILDSVEFVGAHSQRTLMCFGRVSLPMDIGLIHLLVDTDSTAQPNESHLLPIQDGSSAQDNGLWNFSALPGELASLAPGTKVFLSVFGDGGTDFYNLESNQWLPISPSKKSNVISFTIP